MFVIVAVNTEVFPVRSVGRIVKVISVFVVNRQEMPCLFVELSPAFGADEAMDLEGALSIITPWRFGLFQFFKSFFNRLIVSRLLRRSLMMNSIRSVFHGKGPPSPSPSPRWGEGRGEGCDNIKEKAEPGLRSVLSIRLKGPQRHFGPQTPS